MLPLLSVHYRQQGMGHAVTRIDLDGLFEESRSLGRSRRIVPRQRVPLEDALVGFEARGRLASRAVNVGHLHPAYERADDPLYNLVLDGKDLRLEAVKMVTPDLMAARCVDELHRDSDAIADATYAPLDHEANVQFARHGSDVYVGAAVLERR